MSSLAINLSKSLVVSSHEQAQFNLYGTLINQKIRAAFDQKKITEAESKDFCNLITKQAIEYFQRGNLAFFDAVTSNNQCHLIALRVTSLYKGCLENRSFELSVEDQRFLVLSFFLASCFNVNKKLLSELLMDPKKSGPLSKKLNKFLDINDLKINAKAQLIQDINSYVLRLLPSLKNNTPEHLVAELERLTKEGTPYPKFPGVYVMMNEVMRINIPLVFKTKFLCSEGIHRNVYLVRKINQKGIVLSGESPVIVIEGFASLRFSSSEFFKAREKCPGLFNKLKHHDEEDESDKTKCCEPCPKGKECTELLNHKIEFAQIAQSASKLLLAEGADFTQNVQPKFRDAFFTDTLVKKSKYPALTEKFKSYVQYSREKFLSSEFPGTLVIEHAYSDIARFAFSKKSNKRLVETSPSELMNLRGKA